MEARARVTGPSLGRSRAPHHQGSLDATLRSPAGHGPFPAGVLQGYCPQEQGSSTPGACADRRLGPTAPASDPAGSGWAHKVPEGGTLPRAKGSAFGQHWCWGPSPGQLGSQDPRLSSRLWGHSCFSLSATSPFSLRPVLPALTWRTSSSLKRTLFNYELN